MIKSVIWRAIGVLLLGVVTYVYTRDWVTTTLITMCHHGAFIFIYYAHERFWLHTKWLRHSRLKPFMRVITYELVLGNLVLAAIILIFTGEIQQVTAITLTYILNKCWMFYAYDYLWRKIRGTVVYAYVCGDLLHIGHLRALQQAKALGDYLVVGVISDEGVAAYKREPVISFDERSELIDNLRCVDKVVRQETVDPTENLNRLDVDILAHGDDWGEDFPGADYMRSIGKKTIRTKYYSHQSTTKVLEKILRDYEKEPCQKG